MFTTGNNVNTTQKLTFKLTEIQVKLYIAKKTSPNVHMKGRKARNYQCNIESILRNRNGKTKYIQKGLEDF